MKFFFNYAALILCCCLSDMLWHFIRHASCLHEVEFSLDTEANYPIKYYVVNINLYKPLGRAFLNEELKYSVVQTYKMKSSPCSEY